MKGLVATVLSVGLSLGLAFSVPAHAQSNDDDYTPLGSRIKRGHQFPLDLASRFDRGQLTKVNRDRNHAMLNQFSKCVYNRNRTGAVDLLHKTDLGFGSFEQIGLDNDRALKIYGFQDCLGRVSAANSRAVQLRFTPGSLRQWMVHEAYFDHYPDGPVWVKPGNVIAERSYPLSPSDPAVRGAMEFADCVVTADPYGADFFFRAEAGSDDEKKAVESLTPALGPCLPSGKQVALSPAALRLWLGEGLWHAANNSAAAPSATPQDSQ